MRILHQLLIIRILRARGGSSRLRLMEYRKALYSPRTRR